MSMPTTNRPHGVLPLLLALGVVSLAACARNGSGPLDGDPDGLRWASRADFGRRHEPRGDRILHGCGRYDAAYPEDIPTYHDLFPGRAPLVHVFWVGLHEDLSQRLDHILSWVQVKYEGRAIPLLCLQMNEGEDPEKHYEKQVAVGQKDEQLRQLCAYLERFPGPVFLSVGFACNGEWNNYAPADYVAAWRRIRSMARESNLDHVAFVWSIAPSAREKDFMAFYPGDECVDWWGMDIYNVLDLQRKITPQVLAGARAHRRPVMITEASAYGVGCTDLRAWDLWFVPVFRFVAEHPEIKAFNYVNRDWRNYPRWRQWGDCRLETNPYLAVRYFHALGRPAWIHAPADAGQPKEVYDLLAR